MQRVPFPIDNSLSSIYICHTQAPIELAVCSSTLLEQALIIVSHAVHSGEDPRISGLLISRRWKNDIYMCLCTENKNQSDSVTSPDPPVNWVNVMYSWTALLGYLTPFLLFPLPFLSVNVSLEFTESIEFHSCPRSCGISDPLHLPSS